MDDDKQIPCGNDRKKGKNNSRSKDEAEKQIPCANDRKKGNGKDGVEKQIPFGSDRNKGKGRSKDKKGPSLTGLRLCLG